MAGCEELGITDDPRVFRRFDSDEDRQGHIFALNAARRQLVGEAWNLGFAYLLKRRERREITQAQASEQLGINQQRFSELELEALANASVDGQGEAHPQEASNTGTGNACTPKAGEDTEEAWGDGESETPSAAKPRAAPRDQRRKLVDEDVITIVTLSAGGVSDGRIAEKFGVSRQRISQLLQQPEPRRRSPVLGKVGLHPRQMLAATR